MMFLCSMVLQSAITFIAPTPLIRQASAARCKSGMALYRKSEQAVQPSTMFCGIDGSKGNLSGW
jgi:hypothetical protein